MAGKVQTDHAAMCAAYRAGLGQGEIAAIHGASKGTVVRAVTRGIPANERYNLRRQQLLAGARKSSALKQRRKIERGDFAIDRDGDVIRVRAKGFEITLDACDEPLLYDHAWQVLSSGRLNRQERRGGRLQNICIYHDIMGVRPNRLTVVDHINRDPTDNRRSNLRICSYSENSMNRVQRGGHPPRLTEGRSHNNAR